MTAPSATTERAHQAAKRYIYAWGGGRAEGDATMRDLLGGKGAGLAEMTNAGLPVPPGFTITTEACNDYFAAGEQLPTGLWEDVLEAVRAVENETGKGFGNAGQPAPRERPLGRQVQHAGHDGHGPQPRPQRGHAARPHRPDRQRALRLGRLPALHPDVRAHRHGRRRRALRPRPRRRQARPRGRAWTPTSTPATCATSAAAYRDDRARGHRPRVPGGPLRAARPGHQGRLRLVVRQARPRLPREPEDRPRPGHRGQRRDHGLRQHGRRLGHRRGLHARPQHRREGPLRRVPHQRPGRGRRGRHPHAAEDRPDARGDARRLRRVRAHRRAAGEALPRRPGPRVHHRARPPLHAPDAQRQADRRGGREDRHRHGRREGHHQGGGARAHRAGPRRPAPARPVRPGRQGRGTAHRQGPQRLAGRGRRSGRLQRRRRGRAGSSAARRSSSCASRPRPTTSTAWPSPRAS